MTEKEQMKNRIYPGAVMPVMGAALVLLFLASFSVGRYGVPFGQVVRILLSRLMPLERTWTEQMEAVVINVRLPRIVMAMLIGAGLSAAGAAFQGVFQNPMASPDVLGASSGAAFGAALGIFLGLGSAAVIGTAFAFSLVTVILVFLIALRAPGIRVVNLVLAGMMISSLFSAGTSYIKLVADPMDKLPAITYWLMGSLSGVKLSELARAFVPICAGCCVLIALRWRIDLLSLGEDEARTLGVNASAVRFAVILAATLITAAGIAASGMIGWIGLVVPHLCRRLVGGSFRALMPASMLGGALFLLLADNISRNLLAVEIPIGILTAFVGAPFFVWLLLRKEKNA